MNRGDRRERIFVDDADRRRFVDTLGEACAKTGWQVQAYVLIVKGSENRPKGDSVKVALAARLREETTDPFTF